MPHYECVYAAIGARPTPTNVPHPKQRPCLASASLDLTLHRRRGRIKGATHKMKEGATPWSTHNAADTTTPKRNAPQSTATHNSPVKPNAPGIWTTGARQRLRRGSPRRHCRKRKRTRGVSEPAKREGRVENLISSDDFTGQNRLRWDRVDRETPNSHPTSERIQYTTYGPNEP